MFGLRSAALAPRVAARYFAKAAPKVDVEAFVSKRIGDLAYDGDASFLAGPTARTTKLWKHVQGLLAEELRKGVLSVDTKTPSTVASHKAGYIQKSEELIVGLQGEKPLQRTIKPWGGWRMVKDALEAYGYKMDAEVQKIFAVYRKTHNAGVFDVYTPEMRAARSNGILTGLPDAYGRGRIIGDYRRVALYGVDALIAAKEADYETLGPVMLAPTMQLREEVREQIRSLNELKQMAKSYGYDISKPAKNAKEAIQWLYFGYLAAVKEQDGAAMSLGRIDTFLDHYIEADIAAGKLTEEQAQELVDDFTIKLRMVRHLRTPAYNALFAGDPQWVTIVLGGTRKNGEHYVTKTSFRILQTLRNLGPAPEPNITVLWNPKLPEGFKRFAAEISIDTSSIQYENDAVMNEYYGHDYAIACCVSGMALGKQMQFFGARCNLPKLLLYVMNQGKDEVSGEQVAPAYPPMEDGPLVYEDIKARFEKGMEWLAGVYANTMNIIHWSHDKYCYEKLELALHDTHVERLMAYGIAGLSVIADSLSAIKYAKVTPVRNEKGLAVDFKIEGDFPKYGNDDDRVDEIARWAVETMMAKLRKHSTYRNAKPTMSVLTITSNVVYGQNTGNTPDGRKKGEAFAPGANPMHGRDSHGAIASLNSVAKLPYCDAQDGISNTFTIVPSALGKDQDSRVTNLVSLLSGYFDKNAHHLNVNVLNRERLIDAMEHPEKYPSLAIRVSGYAVYFTRLSRQQQLEVIARTFHSSM